MCYLDHSLFHYFTYAVTTATLSCSPMRKIEREEGEETWEREINGIEEGRRQARRLLYLSSGDVRAKTGVRFPV